MMINLNSHLTTILSAIFAGIAISLGGIVFLRVGGIIGSVLFTFGLLTVVHYSLKLYTGTCGFLNYYRSPSSWVDICFVIIGNILGCILVGWLISLCSGLNINEPLNPLVEQRINLPLYEVLIRAMGCGLIMTTVVKFAREGRFLPLLFGVPLFIMCGFLHSIADSFYYSCYAFSNNFSLINPIIEALIVTYIGNFFGCNAYKLFLVGNKQ